MAWMSLRSPTAYSLSATCCDLGRYDHSGKLSHVVWNVRFLPTGNHRGDRLFIACSAAL